MSYHDDLKEILRDAAAPLTFVGLLLLLGIGGMIAIIKIFDLHPGIHVIVDNQAAAPGSPSPFSSPLQDREAATPNLEDPEQSFKAELPAGSFSQPCGLTGLNEPQRSALQGFHSETVLSWIKAHPNSPVRFIPRDASQDSLDAFEREFCVILTDYAKERDRLLAVHGDDLLGFVADERVVAMEQDRQTRMKALVKSLWPEAKSP